MMIAICTTAKKVSIPFKLLFYANLFLLLQLTIQQKCIQD